MTWMLSVNDPSALPPKTEYRETLVACPLVPIADIAGLGAEV